MRILLDSSYTLFSSRCLTILSLCLTSCLGICRIVLASLHIRQICLSLVFLFSLFISTSFYYMQFAIPPVLSDEGLLIIPMHYPCFVLLLHNCKTNIFSFVLQLFILIYNSSPHFIRSVRIIYICCNFCYNIYSVVPPCKRSAPSCFVGHNLPYA